MIADTPYLLEAGAVVVAYLIFCAFIFWWYKRRNRHEQPSAASDAVLIGFASQTGFAEQLAWQTAELLKQANVPVRVLPLGQVTASALASCGRALFSVSTTGEGDAPDSAAGFTRRVMGQSAVLSGLRYGLLSLGDRTYPQYCAFGRLMASWLDGNGAVPMFAPVEVDNGDENALREWQAFLAVLTGNTESVDWSAPRAARWRLAERVLLNPGSPGGPVFTVALECLEETPVAWRAGDIAQVEVTAGPHREYSIASLPEDGRLELLVRQMKYPDGRLGIGSGLLTAVAPVGSELAVRVRENRSFHPPAADCPVILIGNGTGMAGLRAHLKSQAAAGRRRNWLLFGERTSAHDFFFRHEVENWQRSGILTRVDLAFSRDGSERTYVQHRLRAAGDDVRDWVAKGAAIYVCGSLEGMAAGVTEVLTELLGVETLEGMAEDGRYRRDVY